MILGMTLVVWVSASVSVSVRNQFHLVTLPPSSDFQVAFLSLRMLRIKMCLVGTRSSSDEQAVMIGYMTG